MIYLLWNLHRRYHPSAAIKIYLPAQFEQNGDPHPLTPR
jgi:hypothetical protein